MITFSWELEASSDAGGEGRDLELELVDGVEDLRVFEGDLQLVRDVAAIVSDLKSRLQTFAREYFLDTSIGVPWLQSDGQYPAILGGKPNLPRSSEIFRGVILGTPGIAELLNFAVTSAGRELGLRFRCSTDTGEVITAALSLSAGGN